MKVLMQNRGDVFDRWGGDSTQMIETKNALEKLNVEVDISSDEAPNLNDYDLVHLFHIDQNIENRIKQLRNAKKNNKPVVLSTIYWDLDYLYNSKEIYLYSKFPRQRIIAKIDYRIPKLIAKLYFRFSREKYLMKTLLDEADILLPNSNAELEIVINKFKMPNLREKSLIVPNGVSKSKLEYSNLTIDLKIPEEYILEVGVFGPHKGQLNLIKSLLDYPEIPLVFVGKLEGSYANECIKMSKKRGNTYFVGEISHNQVYSFYKNAKVHALPSLRESPGLSTLEASIFGINCVVSFYGPVNEYFGFDAFYCDPFDINSIQKAVLAAWDSPKSNKLKNRILNNFTWDKAALKTLEAYNHILNKKL